ncbi:zinc ribbon domain-containing protein [Devosia sp. YIM 151766]|uniref:zinc ribbon domain-containing protein n=1 Tax=Devosia sp. YIM 151766 TaxID=3017325 RepID=UPI00255D0FE1|nr:zinc ribbon domain-containing protein [Devosia sp. YIM 151766]WIY51469.1 zinc ribbon domain-containing protein [Devosia sp. YIM 151766]
MARLDRGLLRTRLVACLVVAVLLVAIVIYNRSALLLLSSPGTFEQIGAYWNYLQTNMRGEPLAYGVLMTRFIANLIGLGTFALAMIAIVLGALRLLARTLWETLIHLRNAIPEDAPEGYRHIDEVVSTLTTRKIAVNQNYHQFLKATFGAAAAFVPPAAQPYAQGAASRLASLSGRIVGYIVLSGLVLGGIYFLHLDNVLNSMFNPAFAREVARIGALEAALSLSPPIILLLALVAILSAVDFAFLRAVVPARLPAVDSESLAETLSASTDYRNIINQLPNKAEARRFQNIPNRVVQMDAEAASAAISDAGTFEARLVIERQPLPMGNPVAAAARLRLVAGWSLYGVGMIVGGFLVLPAAVEQFFRGVAVDTPSAFLPPALAMLYLFASHRFRRAGLYHMEAGEALYRVQRFRSLFAFIRLRGTQHKAEVRVGKADSDSVETSTQVTHPEFLAEVWAGTVEAEVGDLDRPRDLVTISRTDDSHDWLTGIFGDVRTLCAKRVEMVGVNLDNKDLQDVVRGNVNISAQREGNAELARRQAAFEAALTGPLAPAQIEAADIPLVEHGRFCTACGQPAGREAQFCSKCGQKLETEEA